LDEIGNELLPWDETVELELARAGKCSKHFSNDARS
jgi:hypothetical protein